MPITDIISLPGERPGSSYLRIIIRSQIYSEAFPTLVDLHRYFMKNPGALQGETLPPTVRQTNLLELFGKENKHSLIAVLDDRRRPMYYLVGGPSSHLYAIFEDGSEAIDFARIQAAEYDQA
ncbi:MAG: hypothetical protein J0H31_08645 [Alphaproteobacteria bacterium]|nr:hypothetical protein [Alphaproteobacteria bacterium]